jgi:hypothetical protein
MLNNVYSENRAVYEKMWKKYGTTRQATDMRSEHVILIAFSWQYWLRERASTLRYTYIACLVFSKEQ